MIARPLRMVIGLALLAWGSLCAAEAGKVLMLQGVAVAVRGGQEIALTRGLAIESGDVLQVGPASSLQVRFTDGSVVALRANSEMRVDEYQYTEQGSESDKSFFSLLKGGLRTVTGMIGKRNHEAYQMRSVPATIGIRGTHFIAVYCAGDCANADGSLAQDGLYGSVIEGRIVVFNQTGEREFLPDDYFYVPATTAAAQPLLAPPPFLRDRLDGLAQRGRAPGAAAQEVAQEEAQTAAQTAARAAAPAMKVETVETLVPAPGAATDLAGTAAYTPLAAVAIGSPNPPSPPSSTLFSGTWSYSYVQTAVGHDSLGALSPKVSGAYGLTKTFTDLDTTLTSYTQVDSTTPSSTVSVTRLAPYVPSTAANSYLLADGPQTSVSSLGTVVDKKGASTDTGSASTAAGTLQWGRYEQISTQSLGTFTNTDTQDRHWAIGPALTALPTNGTLTFSSAGGTAPTDQFGHAGDVINPGAWTVNFGSNALYSASPVTWQMPVYDASGANLIPGASLNYTLHVTAAAPLTFSTSSASAVTTSINGGSGGTITTASAGLNPIGIGAPALTVTAGGTGIMSVGLAGESVVAPQFTGSGSAVSGLLMGIGTSVQYYTTASSTAPVSQQTAQTRTYKSP